MRKQVQHVRRMLKQSLDRFFFIVVRAFFSFWRDRRDGFGPQPELLLWQRWRRNKQSHRVWCVPVSSGTHHTQGVSLHPHVTWLREFWSNDWRSNSNCLSRFFTESMKQPGGSESSESLLLRVGLMPEQPKPKGQSALKISSKRLKYNIKLRNWFSNSNLRGEPKTKIY